MKIFRTFKKSALSLLGVSAAAAALCLPLTAGALDKVIPLPEPIPPVVKKIVNIPCCRCLQGAKSGVDISTDGSVPWLVTAATLSQSPGGAVTPVFQPGLISNPHPSWTVATSQLLPAGWLQPAPAGPYSNFTNGPYTYKLSIMVPKCIIPMGVKLTGKFSADDEAKLYLDPPPSSSSSAPIYLGMQGFNNVTSFTQAMNVPGVWTLRAEIRNVGGGPTAFAVKGFVTRACKGGDTGISMPAPEPVPTPYPFPVEETQ